MQRLYTADNLAMAEHLRAVLAQEGIKTVIKNQYLSGGIGELPVLDCLPELWLLNPAQARRAEAVIAELTRPAAQAGWCCPGCAEFIEGQFGQCWNCGRTAD